MTDKRNGTAAARPQPEDGARRAFLRKSAGLGGAAAVTLILAAGTKSARAQPISNEN